MHSKTTQLSSMTRLTRHSLQKICPVQSLQFRAQGSAQSRCAHFQRQQASQAHAAAIQLSPRSSSVTVITSTLRGTAVRLQSSTVFRGPYSALLRLYSARKVRSRLRKTFLTIRRMQELSLLHLTSLAFTTQAARTHLTSGSSAPTIWEAGNSLTCS